LANEQFKSNQSPKTVLVRLIANAGKTHGIRPTDVVGTIAYHSDIPGLTIGEIKIRAELTIVDVPEQFVQQVGAKNSDYQVRKQRITIGRTKQS
jgi:ATP-dependent RNA helicase DeaD